MSGVLGWLKSKGVKLIDPNREGRIAALSEEVWNRITQQRSEFDFSRTMIELGADVEDNPLVARRAYENALGRAWKDGEITEKERASLNVIGRLLRMTKELMRDIEWQTGLQVFGSAIADAFEDGQLEPHETQRLALIARGMQTTTRELMRNYFSDAGEGFLRNLFTGIVEGVSFTSADWTRLVHAALGLGIPESELCEFVRPQAELYVEHVLADMKSDGRVTQHERQSLQWLLDTFQVTSAFQTYVVSEIATVDMYKSIRAGRLPSIRVANVTLRAGELAHFQSAAAWAQVRQLRNGPRVYRHDGLLTITDSRFIFASETKSIDMNHRRVVGLEPFEGGFEVRCSGSGGGYYYLLQTPRLGSSIYETAVGKANQVIVQRIEGGISRHIPRDVRQRVWQQYGGRCIECGATQYLEFDHIVPVAKGGSSTETNVQLLCRGCNGKKSDLI